MSANNKNIEKSTETAAQVEPVHKAAEDQSYSAIVKRQFKKK